MAALGKQPTPFRISLQDLRFAQPEVVIFASSNLHTKVVSTTTSGISPAPLLPPEKDGRPVNLVLCTTVLLCCASGR